MPDTELMQKASKVAEDTLIKKMGIASISAADKAHKVLKILLLEDVATDSALIQMELRHAKIAFSVQCVETRDDFLRALQEFRPDVILSDFSMPQFNALEALHLLQESRRDLPFILVTGSQSEEVAVECMKEGADDYILKTSLKRLPLALLNTLKKKEAESEKERATQAMKESEEHFRSLIENASDIIAVLNADGTFRYASPSVKNLGYKPEELFGRNLLSFIYRDDEQEARTFFNQIRQNAGRLSTFEFLFQHKEGSWRVLEVIGKSIHLHSDQIGIVLNARDATERKESETAMEKMAAFARLNPNPVLELSAHGQLSYCNQAAEEMAKMLGKAPAEILPPDTLEVIRECLSTGKSNLHRETPVGNCILSWSFFPIIPSQLVHCYATDITDRLSLEAQLRQSQKMESIGQLAAGVAHDFNNILTLIQGYSGLLLDEENLDPEFADSLQQISSASQRASNLTRQLLMFGRKQIMQPQGLDMNDVIANITKLLRRILGEDITLHFNYSPNLPKAHADAGMMEQVLMNLAVNARDAMPRGGQLTIGTAVVQINETHVRANSEARKGEFVCLRVSDSGSGIPREIVSKIFEPFFTTKEVGKGTGLGLATVYGIVKQHQGWIEVLSEMDRGTTFRVFLPTSEQTEKVAQPKESPRSVRGGSEKILVVEDEPELRALVIDILESYGYQIFQAASGPEALPIWEKHASKIDLLLTDMVMPGNMTGRELAEKLKKQKPGLKVIYTSGYSMDTLGKDFTFKRGLNFLPKPYHPLTLVNIVRDCLDS